MKHVGECMHVYGADAFLSILSCAPRRQHTCMWVHGCMHAHACVHTYACMRAYVCVRVCARRYVMHAYMCVCVDRGECGPRASLAACCCHSCYPSHILHSCYPSHILRSQLPKYPSQLPKYPSHITLAKGQLPTYSLRLTASHIALAEGPLYFLLLTPDS